MIDKSLTFLLGELNGFLANVFPASEPHAVLSNLAMHDGSPPREIENKLVLTLANIERETTAFNRDRAASSAVNSTLQMNAPLNLNVYFLLSASFPSDAAQSLRFLSAALGYLQSKPVYTPQNSAGFPRALERLTVEMVNLSITDLQNLWATTGAKYLPSAFYKARMITIQDGWVVDRVPVITGTDQIEKG